MKSKNNPNENRETRTSQLVRKYWDNSWYAKKLRENGHTLDTYGVWFVRGEDPNADLHGPHHEPYLGTFEGRLEDVIAEAVYIPGFFTWGGGGSFTLKEGIPVRKVSKESRLRRAEIRDFIDELRARIVELEEEYENT